MSPWAIKVQTIWWILPYKIFKRHKYRPAISIWGWPEPMCSREAPESIVTIEGRIVGPFTQSKHHLLCQGCSFTCHILPAWPLLLARSQAGAGRGKWNSVWAILWVRSFLQGSYPIQGIQQSVNHKTNVHCKLRQSQPGRKLPWLNISHIINRSSCLVQHEITKKQQDIPYIVATETPSMHLEEAWTVIVSYILWLMLRLQRQIQVLFLGCSRVKLSLLFTSGTREGTKCYVLFIFYQCGKEINRFQFNISLSPMLIKMPLSLLRDWALIAHLEQWNHPNLTQGFYKVKRESKDQAWSTISAEYTVDMAVILASRRVPPSAEFNPIPSLSSGFPELSHKQRKHWDNIHFNIIAPTLPTPAVCSLKQ